MTDQRRKRILERLDVRGTIKVSELSQEFQCTPMTIRRDLKELEQMGLIRRTHGGAVKIGSNFVTQNVKELVYSNTYHKMWIARLAFSCIEPGMTLFIDDASTCLYLAQEIKKDKRKPVTVITNSLLAATEFMQTPHVYLKLIGGDITANLSATAGETARKQIAACRADLSFIGVNGVDSKAGITGIGYPQMEIKKAMIQASDAVYILADSSKFGKRYLSEICGFGQVKEILTDKDLPAAVLKEFWRADIPLRNEQKEEQ